MNLQTLEKKLKKDRHNFILKQHFKKSNRFRGACFIASLLMMTIGLGTFILQEKYVYSKWVETSALVEKVQQYDKKNLLLYDKKDLLLKDKPHYSYSLQYEINGTIIRSSKETTGTPFFKDGETIRISVNPSNLQQHRFQKGDIGTIVNLFWGLLIFTMATSYIYFTEELRLRNKDVLARAANSGKIKRKPFRTTLIVSFFCSLLIPLPLALHSPAYFFSIFGPTLISFIISSHLLLNFAWKKRLLQPKIFFYGGIFWGFVIGVSSFILGAITHHILPSFGLEGTKPFAVFALLSGWIVGPVYMLVLWAFAVGTQLKWKIINTMILLCVIILPFWYFIASTFFPFLLLEFISLIAPSSDIN